MNTGSNVTLAITICATRSYAYALLAQARRVVANLVDPTQVILVGDDSDEIKRAKSFYEEILPTGSNVTLVTGNFEDGHKNYKNAAQLTIAQMRSVAFDRARKLNVDLCWSLDSDVLPPRNALLCSRQMLAFDDGYYSISTCPYPSQGGGDFLGGRGTPEHPILPDFYDDERAVPAILRKRMKDHSATLKSISSLPVSPDKKTQLQKWHADREAIAEEVKKCSPTGNVFAMNAKKYRRRGWMSAAYPGIGQGAVLPSDWCGFGCTLMNKRALALAQFDGYDGAGTEDLYIVWKRWHPSGLRICVIPHAPCDHVIRDQRAAGPDSASPKKTKYILCRAFHEQRDPECVGHLRIEHRPWYQQTEGEIFDETNNGQITSSVPPVEAAVPAAL